MATNQYFSSNYFADNADQQLVQNLNTESIQIYGLDAQYLPRNLVNFDELFGEDQSSNFDRAYTIELYLKSFDGFGGDGKFLSNFGIEIRDEMTFLVSRPRFVAEVGTNEPDIDKPREGDLILVQSAIDSRNRIFEITYVESEDVFHQLGSLYTWEIRTKLFELGGETFETGDVAIDSIDDISINRELILTDVVGVFQVGERVATSTSSGEVVSFDGVDKLVISDIIGDMTTGVIAGETSFSTATIGSVSQTIENPSLASDNDYLNTTVSDFVDFTESNPFSET
jgi:hypothetical protein